MMEKLKMKIFPCSLQMETALQENSKATQRLIEACQTQHKFPELKEGHIVNPR